MSVNFRIFNRSSDLPRYLELFENAFPETVNTPQSTGEHYTWKYETFPSSPQSFQYAAFEDDKLVGFYGAIPYRYSICGTDHTAGMVCDVMTHSSMRGKGVFTGIGRYACDDMKNKGISFTTGYPVRPEVIPGHLKVGWKIAFKLPMFIKVFRSDSILKARGLGFISVPVNIVIYLINFIVSLFSRDKSGYVTTEKDFSEFFRGMDFKKFIDDWKRTVPNHLIKDEAFYRWRLGEPSCKYRFLASYKDGRLTGMAIVRNVVLQKIPTLAILDLMTLEGHEKCADNLFNKMARIASAEKIEALALISSTKIASRYRFLRSGVIKSPFIFRLIINKLNPRISDENIYSEGNWHLMWIDSDDL